jgi:hypothetical protein
MQQKSNKYTILITGSCQWQDTGVIRKLIISSQKKHPTKKVRFIFGDCPLGADRIAYGFCLAYDIKYVRLPSYWDKSGKRQKIITEHKLAEYHPDEAFAFREPGALNTGTDLCIDICLKLGIKLTILGEQLKG